jgi:hypothetical protein
LRGGRVSSNSSMHHVRPWHHTHWEFLNALGHSQIKLQMLCIMLSCLLFLILIGISSILSYTLGIPECPRSQSKQAANAVYHVFVLASCHSYWYLLHSNTPMPTRGTVLMCRRLQGGRYTANLVRCTARYICARYIAYQ